MNEHVVKARFLHSANGRQKPPQRNRARDAIKIRELWYDHGIRFAGILRRYEIHGWSLSQIADVVYYRTYRSLQPQDVVRCCREAYE